MAANIEQSTIDALGGNAVFAQMVADYTAALVAHAKTEGVAAPMPPNQLVARVVKEFGGAYNVFTQQPGEQTPLQDTPRVIGLKSDAAYVDLLNRAKTSTAAEIDAWFQANVTTVAQARGVLSAIVKLLATRL